MTLALVHGPAQAECQPQRRPASLEPIARPSARDLLFDDFSGASLDPAKWIPVLANWSGTDSDGLPHSGGVVLDNVALADGHLVLRAHGDLYAGPVRGVDRQGHRLAHGRRVGAAVKTRETFGSARYEARLRIVPVSGVATAMWTFFYEERTSGPTGAAAAGPAGNRSASIVNHEIDIELPGRPGPDLRSISFRYALLSTWRGLAPGTHTTRYQCLTHAVDDGAFHVIRFDWHAPTAEQEGKVAFYIDGQLQHIEQGVVPYRPAQLWLGAWFPKVWAGPPAFATATMLIDWVRISKLAQ